MCVFTFETSVTGVSDEARGTELADWSVVLHVAGCVVGTAGCQTGILAAVVPAGLVAWAAAVSQADGQGGVAVAYAHAHRPVFEYLARLVPRARARATGVSAAAGNAGAVRGALFVPDAFGVFGRALQLAAFAQHEAALADAHGTVSVHLAPLVTVTELHRAVARVVALVCLQVAGERGRTVAVGFA